MSNPRSSYWILPIWSLSDSELTAWVSEPELGQPSRSFSYFLRRCFCAAQGSVVSDINWWHWRQKAANMPTYICIWSWSDQPRQNSRIISLDRDWLSLSCRPAPVVMPFHPQAIKQFPQSSVVVGIAINWSRSNPLVVRFYNWYCHR